MLAIKGGKSVISNPMAVHKPYPQIGENEHKYINQVLQSGKLWGTWAPMVTELEDKWANFINTKYCLAVCSGTSALHCAIYGCGVQPSDEVIVPAYSFIATASTVLMANAIPIFADVDINGNICLASIEKNINEKTKAIIVVHIHGLPANIFAIKEIAKKHNLLIIEDCSQAHGAEINGIRVGSIGDIGTFSLNATKVLAGGEGGLITTNNEPIFNRIAKMRVFGMEIQNYKRFYRDADGLGYNYRISEFCAAFALARFEQFEKEQLLRIENVNYFLNGIKDLKGIFFDKVEDNKLHIYQLLRLRLLPNAIGISLDVEVFRYRLLLALEREGCFFWVWEGKSLPAYKIFQNKNIDGGGLPWMLHNSRKNISYEIKQYPNSNQIVLDSIFTTSHYPPNDKTLMESYIKAFRKIWNNLDDVINLNEYPPNSNYVTPF